MKSNKQRRAEIKQLRLERAARIARSLQAAPWTGHAHMAGVEPADTALLARLNNSYDAMPRYYADRPFRCRDCGAEEVWTAKQQKWWYEVVKANINSGATRCLPCRRARRAALARSRAGQGANRLGEEAAWLRSLDATRPDAQTEARVEAALASKWDGVRKVAVEVLGRWKRPQDAERLRAWATDGSRPWYDATRRAAAHSLERLEAERARKHGRP